MVVAGLALSNAAECHADKAAEAMRELVFEGIRQRAEKLRQGNYVADGRKTVAIRDGSPEDRLDGTYRMRGAFDLEQGWQRFDKREPAHVIALESAGPPPDASSPKTPPDVVLPDKPPEGARTIRDHMETFYFSNQELCGYLVSGQDSVVLDRPSSTQIPAEVRPLDIRAVGMLGWREFNLRTTLDEILAAYRGTPSMAVVELPDQKYKLTIRRQESRAYTVWDTVVDAARGFTPTETVLTKYGDKGPQVLQRSTTTWQQVSGCWVPRHYRIESGAGDGPEHRVVDVEFDWVSVNEPLPEEVFSYNDFPGVSERGVADFSQATPTMLRIPQRLASSPYAPKLEREPQAALRWQYVVALNAATLVAIAGVVMWRRRRRVSPQE
jgi:hypothetical protein